MALLLHELVDTTLFTPKEYQVELLYTAKEKNIIVCLGRNSEQTFVVIKLIQEFSFGTRRLLSEGGKRSIYILRNQDKCSLKANYIRQLTDLKTCICDSVEDPDFEKKFSDVQVIITTAETCTQLVEAKKILPSQINLLLVDQCHKFVRENTLDSVLTYFSSSEDKPRIVGLAVPLFNLTEIPGRIVFEIQKIETLFRSEIETGSDIMSILRYSPVPKEIVIEYDEGDTSDLCEILESYANHVRTFLEDHMFDQKEIYKDFIEDVKKMPNPTQRPLELIEDFLYILKNLGPWCADRAALALLMSCEKLKVTSMYDRHFILLNMMRTLFIKIRAACDHAFASLSDKDKIYNFLTPKAHKLLKVLKTYTPFHKKNLKDEVKEDSKKEMLTQKEPIKRDGNWRSNEGSTKKPLKTRYHRGITDPDLLCGIIFVNKGLTAKILFYLLNELRKHDEELHFLSPLYTSEQPFADLSFSPEVAIQHKKQEEVLKRFRIHECNLLIATSILEEGIDIPKCNLVARFDFPKNYKSYVQCKSRARTVDALHTLLVLQSESKDCVWKLAQYHYIEKILLAKCANKEPTKEEEMEADKYADIIPEYKPLEGDDAAKVSFNSAIALVNRYCAKLPSDTFTRLTPEWSTEVVEVDGNSMYVCSLRLPINSPMKYIVSSYPMPNRAMARRMAALQLCVELHRGNELDDSLLPIGKENFKAKPEDVEVPASPDESKTEFSEARPGTTKRRQYYYKKTAEAFVDCRPMVRESSHLYHINMVLSCPLPEEQNTRGRKIYPPEDSDIGFGILTLKKIPTICPFPIYTRSGEVHVSLALSKKAVWLDAIQMEKIITFLNFTFTNVLRLQKYLMLFDPYSSEYSYIIVPVKKVSTIDGIDIQVDWDFLDCIYQNQNTIPRQIPEEERNTFEFDASKYHDAVIMPWYRNKDQPQYFYVAEICPGLNPKSSFPGSDYHSFEEYYLKKYEIQIQNLDQPLLDVDHTSARLNFLTPRYVNRKGVALPTSSEETKRAKRENLEQKQILVPELCAIHPFPASLWRQAVCLPCILYRINALLLADQIRCNVAAKINLGQENLDPDFKWQPLDFGWSLAEVLIKSKELEKANEVKSKTLTDSISESKTSKKIKEFPVQEEIDSPCSNGSELEIGTWSNDMAPTSTDFNSQNIFPLNDGPLSPESENTYDSDETYTDNLDGYSYDNSEEESSQGLRIEYKAENVAEAIEDEKELEKRELNRKMLEILKHEKNSDVLSCSFDEEDEENLVNYRFAHFDFAKSRKQYIMRKGYFFSSKLNITLSRKMSIGSLDEVQKHDFKHKYYIVRIANRFKKHISDKYSVPKTVKKQNATCVMRNKSEELFSFDSQPELQGHPGPSPSLILQALTMSNANDGINLERLETIGDSFLKYAITTYLYCTYDNIHEGKLSHLRSKQVSNLNLYRLGKKQVLGESMIATKFEPHDNWLPPCYYVPKEIEQVLIKSGIPSSHWNQADMPTLQNVDPTEIGELVRETEHKFEIMKNELEKDVIMPNNPLETLNNFIPYNLITQHSIPDKSIADCVEALIGAYLIACGPRGALLFMAWLGIHVLPTQDYCVVQETEPEDRPPGSTIYVKGNDEVGRTTWTQTRYGKLEEPQNPLVEHVSNPQRELELMLDGYDLLEEKIAYRFRDRSFLLQAFTHASYQPNRLTDCYQRLEFLGDAILDYLITRHLYEDSRQHSPGALTDLRSALVNNTIFASLAVRCGFHKYFRHLSPGLSIVIDRFVRIQEQNGHSISEECYLIGEEEREEAEDVEVPKALGDVFESLAGAIYLDSGMSLDAVWGVYYKIMKFEIEQFSTNVPKSPIRELLELEPETAKFGKPEKLADGRRVRVTVEVFGKGSFKGIGRNYRIAKCTAAKCALKKLKKFHSYKKEKL